MGSLEKPDSEPTLSGKIPTSESVSDKESSTFKEQSNAQQNPKKVEASNPKSKEFKVQTGTTPSFSTISEISESTQSLIPDRDKNESISKETQEIQALQEPSITSTKNPTLELVQEWKTLENKIKGWLGNRLSSYESSNFIKPYLLIVGSISLLIFLKAYSSLLETLEKFPLAPNIFEIIGILWLMSFFTEHLLREKDRQNLKQDLRRLWRSFSG